MTQASVGRCMINDVGAEADLIENLAESRDISLMVQGPAMISEQMSSARLHILDSPRIYLNVQACPHRDPTMPTTLYRDRHGPPVDCVRGSNYRCE